jgi:alkanesulfonate monooxygenase SsuD/methylene tetrahydromethanopterin reductase-like flavin-dependent oxidoreductase (luciferase family)
MVAQYADACNLFGDVEGCKHLLGVLERHCENLGRDFSEITKTRMGVLLIAPTHEAAAAKLEAIKQGGMLPERLQASMLAGDPDTVAEQAAAFRDVGIEGLTISLPDVHDLESLALAGRTLGPVFGAAG